MHFIPPSGRENDVWAFHAAIDCFAHFRRDGETSGVAIAESLTAGNPIVTHRSSIWNAHLEYLTSDCARVAEIDAVDEYASYMREYMRTYKSDTSAWKVRCEAARLVGEKHFSPNRYVDRVKSILQNSSVRQQLD